MKENGKLIHLEEDFLDELASVWHVKQSRGLTREESNELLQLIQKHPRLATKLKEFDEQLEMFKQLPQSFVDEMMEQKSSFWTPRNIGWAASLAAVLVLGIFGVFQFTTKPDILEEVSPIMYASVDVPFTRALEDHSIVRLNKGAKLEVDYSDSRRLVRLLDGEAHFSVQKNPNRPFVVLVDGIEVEAVGTAFNVKRGDQINIIVTEGVVRVLPQYSVPHTALHPEAVEEVVVPPTPNFVSKGEVAEITKATELQDVFSIQVFQATTEAVQEELSWQESLLTLDGKTLSDIAESFEQRTGYYMVIVDPMIRDLEIGGRFPSDDVYSFLRILQTGYGIPWEEVDDRIIWVGQKPDLR